MADQFWAPSIQEALMGYGLNPSSPTMTYVDLGKQFADIGANQAKLDAALKQAAATLKSTETATRGAESKLLSSEEANKFIKARLKAAGKQIDAELEGQINTAYPEVAMPGFPKGREVSLDEVEAFINKLTQKPSWIQGKPFVATVAMNHAGYKDIKDQPLKVGEEYSTVFNAADPTDVKFIPSGMSLETEAAKGAGKRDPILEKARLAAANAKAALDTTAKELGTLKGLNKKSRAGAFGALLQQVSSGLNVGQESEEYKNTERVVNSLKSMVAKVLKSTFGGQLSEGERAYLQNVYAAAPQFTKVQREIAMNTVERMLRDASYQADQAVLELGGELGRSPTAMSGMELPEETPITEEKPKAEKKGLKPGYKLLD